MPTLLARASGRAIPLMLALGLAAGGASAQTAYPTRAISLVVPFAAGGPTDVVARSLGAAMSKTLGQSIVVENRTGAGGTLASAHVARAAPDGYTLLIHHNGMATAPALYRKLSFNPLTDFAYVGQVADVPMTLLGRKDLPPGDMAGFIKYARDNGNKINLANAGLGAVSQLCGMLLQEALGTQFTTVPYAGTAPLTALLGGQVDVLCDQTTQTIPHIKSGRVKLYGVTTLDRIHALPDTPTLQEGGLQGFEVKVWHGVYAPRGTPPEAIEKINAARGAEGSGLHAEDGRTGRGDRARSEANAGRPASVAASGGRQVGRSSARRGVRGLTEQLMVVAACS